MSHGYRAAIIGLGNIAWRLDYGATVGRAGLTHTKAYLNESRAELVGGFSPKAEERQAFSNAFDIPVFSSAAELLEKSRPDIVSICSPPEFHLGQVLLCVERKIPMVWLEKPPTQSVRDTDNLLDAIDEHGGCTRVLVNYQRRYVEEYGRLATIYRERTLGTCRGIHVSYSKGLETNGSHILDALFFVRGDEATYSVEWATRDSDENPCFGVRFADGLVVTVSGMDLPYHCIDISLVCEEGRVSALHGGMTFVQEERVEHELFPGYYRLRENPSPPPSQSDLENGFEKALADLMDSFEQKRQPISNLRTARNTQLLIEKVVGSGETL